MHGGQRQGGPLRSLGALRVVGVPVHVDDADPLRQLRLLGAALTPALARLPVLREQKVPGNGRYGCAAADPKAQDIVALHRIDEEGLGQGLDRPPHGGLSADDVARHRRVELGGVDIIRTEPGATAEIGHDGRERLAPTTAAAEEQPGPAAVGADQDGVGHRIVDLGAGLVDGTGPGLVAHHGPGGCVEPNDPVAAHQGPALAEKPALAGERPLDVDLARDAGLPDDAGVLAPLDRMDRPGGTPGREGDLEDDAVVGGIVGEPAGGVEEAGGAGREV